MATTATTTAVTARPATNVRAAKYAFKQILNDLLFLVGKPKRTNQHGNKTGHSFLVLVFIPFGSMIILEEGCVTVKFRPQMVLNTQFRAQDCSYGVNTSGFTRTDPIMSSK